MSRRFWLLPMFAVALLPALRWQRSAERRGADPREHVNAWTDATATGDGEAACALMTEGGQEAMTDPEGGNST